ncbi:MAG: hypothetical protein ED557_02890 [Balneola sp.]|nr:MAG: hypothetical protein ED557_02890 [Balneola sp.]
MRHLSILSLLLIVILSQCDSIEVADFTDYPTSIEPYLIADLVTLNTRYQQENEGHICSTLNEFGFSGFSRVLFIDDVNPCLDRTQVRVELTRADTLIPLAKKSLLMNSEYTLVTDTTALILDEVIPLYGCTICEGPDINSVPIEYKISFKPQIFEGVKVNDSRITVFVDSIGVNRIWGNWFPEFVNPDFINIGYEEAQDMLLGWDIDMEPFTGGDTVFTVQEEHVQTLPEFEFYPYNNEGVLELRKTWKVFIQFNDDTFEGWYANIDVIDGLFLAIEPVNAESEF